MPGPATTASRIASHGSSTCGRRSATRPWACGMRPTWPVPAAGRASTSTCRHGASPPAARRSRCRRPGDQPDNACASSASAAPEQRPRRHRRPDPAPRPVQCRHDRGVVPAPPGACSRLGGRRGVGGGRRGRGHDRHPGSPRAGCPAPRSARLRAGVDDRCLTGGSTALAVARAGGVVRGPAGLLREAVIADAFPAVTVLFADIADFPRHAERSPPEATVGLLNDLFSQFDALTESRGLEKIKTVGDAYMAAGGLPDPMPDHAQAVAELALEMLEVAAGRLPDGGPVRLRIGIDSGPVVAGVIGRRKLSYDLWGDTANTASRMETTGVPGCIQVTERTRNLLGERYRFQERGRIQVKGKGKGKGKMLTYFLSRRPITAPSRTQG